MGVSIDYGSLAFFECVSRFSVGVVNTKQENVTENQTTDTVGSATAIMWLGSALLLTARHVVEGASVSELEFMPQSTPALVLKRSGTPFQNFDLQSRMQFPIQKILLCDWADLAVIVLATADCHRYMEYYKWDATLTTPEPGTSLYGLGLQADRSSVIDQSVKHRQLETTMAAAKHIITCKVVGQEKGRYVKNFDPECHFLTDYGDLSREFRPHGFSGCGWWRYKDQESLIWTASPIFSGVEFAYASSGNLLINVRPEKVTAFLEEAGARIR